MREKFDFRDCISIITEIFGSIFGYGVLGQWQSVTQHLVSA